GLIEFSDFFPTLADAVGRSVSSDGISFFPLLIGQEDFLGRQTAFVHYDRSPLDKKPDDKRARFVRTVDYKLYSDGRFYDLNKDVEEKIPLAMDQLNEYEKDIYLRLENELRKHPIWVEK